MTKKLSLTLHAGDGTYNNKDIQFLIGATNFVPIVEYKNKQYVLSWEEIIKLADVAGLFEEAPK